MSLTAELDRYLAVRRSLGYDLTTSERILRRFTRFTDAEQTTRIDTALFLRWHGTLGPANGTTRAARLGAVRLFAQWLSSFDPADEPPPRGLLPSGTARARPHIYSDDQVASIIDAARALPSASGVRGLTCSTLFALIAVTGIRVSEALALDVADLDIDAGVLRVREGKNGKERLLPLDPGTVTKLADYRIERDRLIGHRPIALFVTDKATRMTDCTARYTFAQICQQIGLRSEQLYQRHGRGPRIHDLRHTFAVRTMINWYRTGEDPAREIIRLTTYLGHREPSATYWYLEAVPELLDLAMARATAGEMA